MKRLIAILVVSVFGCWLLAQRPEQNRLPSGRLQSELILEADHEKNVEDAKELAELAAKLRDELESHDETILSVSTIRKTEQIEDLAKKIRKRLQRH